MTQWRLGEIRIDRVVESEMPRCLPSVLLPDEHGSLLAPADFASFHCGHVIRGERGFAIVLSERQP